MRLKPLPGSLIVLLWLAANLPAQQSNGPKITEAEIKSAINEYSDCDRLDQIYIDHLEYSDLLGDGRTEAIVVASTCMTGTAGPDVHAVYERGSDGKVVAHVLDWLDPVSGIRSKTLPVFGNPNFGLAMEDGRLVARWMDGSDRKNPLVIWYKWDGKDFVVDHMNIEGPYKTSYNCAKATRELDRAICYSPSLAALDVQLNGVYRSALEQNADRTGLEQQQRAWLVQREKQCVIYKWWVDCLTDMYSKRIAELKESMTRTPH